jgi:16S rRNA (cytosine967-C5)-methyltransferase
MKLHRMLAEAAVQVTAAVFTRGKVLDHELASLFGRNLKWGKRDRSFVAETVFEVVRWRRALAFVADCEETNTAALCAVQWRRMGIELPAWWEHAGPTEADIAERERALPEQPRAVRASIPNWLDELGVAELGEAPWEANLTALNQRARVFLRVNTLRNAPEEVTAWLSSHGVEVSAVPGVPSALVLPEGKSLPKALLTDGRVEIQDAGSQLVAPLLGALPGETVIDACCGAGGKTLHLAAIMENRGTLHGLDIAPRKLEELHRRAKAAKVTCLRTALATPEQVHSLTGQADRLLIDAPCSGLGTLKRQPDLKWRLTPQTLDRVRAVQHELLTRYPAMLRPGGTLVYATCSVLPSENRRQIDRLLQSDRFEWIQEEQISPALTGFDGFCAAALRRKA